MVDGEDPFIAELQPLLQASGCEWSYTEIDPDVFGEELERPVYAHIDRIAAVGLVASLAAELDIGPDARRLSQVRECSLLERMPKWLICVPLVVQWLWLSVRHGGATVPSAANPNLTSGGLVGEGKLEYFEGMGPLARALTADHCAVRNDDAATEPALRQTMERSGLGFPLVVKPNL
eukprot:gene11645-15683_t